MCVYNIQPVETAEEDFYICKVVSKWKNNFRSLLLPADRNCQDGNNDGTTLDYELNKEVISPFGKTFGIYGFLEKEMAVKYTRNLSEHVSILKCLIKKGTKFRLASMEPHSMCTVFNCILVETLTPVEVVTNEVS